MFKIPYYIIQKQKGHMKYRQCVIFTLQIPQFKMTVQKHLTSKKWG